MKFYLSTLAARPIFLGGREFKFTVCSFSAGRANGIFATEDATEIGILNDAVNGRRGVQSISEADYEELKKKATLTRQSANSGVSKPRSVQIPMQPEVAVAEKAGVPSVDRGQVDKPSPSPTHRDTLPLPKVKDLVKVERVSSPTPLAKEQLRVEKAAKRAATVRVARQAEDSR